MADKKISQLPALGTETLNHDTTLAVVVEGTTYKGTLGQVKTWLNFPELPLTSFHGGNEALNATDYDDSGPIQVPIAAHPVASGVVPAPPPYRPAGIPGDYEGDLFVLCNIPRGLPRMQPDDKNASYPTQLPWIRLSGFSLQYAADGDVDSLTPIYPDFIGQIPGMISSPWIAGATVVTTNPFTIKVSNGPVFFLRFYYPLTLNTILQIPVNPIPQYDNFFKYMEQGELLFRQDATGGKTITMPVNSYFLGRAPGPLVDPAPSALTLIRYERVVRFSHNTNITPHEDFFLCTTTYNPTS